MRRPRVDVLRLQLARALLVSTGATSAVALAVLIAINALSNGSAIALAREATCKKREAAARAAATRRSRGASASAPKVRTPRAPFPVVDDQVPTQARRPRPVQWHPTLADDVIDAEIVSEQRLLA
jgi:hypothetical protein